MSNYEKLAAINVNDKIEKKNGLSYLSWAFAVDTLMRADPEANWTYLEPLQFGDTLMVRCAVTAFGKTMVCQLPVMDYKNKAVEKPDAFAVNTAMQRCLVKAIALHGLGLYIYAGEDMPQEPDWSDWMNEKRQPIEIALSEGNTTLARDLYEEAMAQLPTEIVQKQFHFLFGSADRAALKAEGKRRADAEKQPEQQAA